MTEPAGGPPSGPLPVNQGPPAGSGPADRRGAGADPHDSRLAAHESVHHEPVHHEPSQPVGHNQDGARAANLDAGYGAATRMNDPDQMDGRSGDDDDRLWAMMGYLGMIFFAFIPPLSIYLLKRSESRYVRFHAAQAVNLWITVSLYSLSFVIIGGILTLDAISTALSVGVPLIAAAALALLIYSVLAAAAAIRGKMYRIPGWICVPIVT
jgi:uncharacterized Tic20 family protein